MTINRNILILSALNRSLATAMAQTNSFQRQLQMVSL